MMIPRIEKLSSAPVQGFGTIGRLGDAEPSYRFYFRGRSERWQFVAGPIELSTDGMVEKQLNPFLEVVDDPRVFIAQGDDQDQSYNDHATAMVIIAVCTQQFEAWQRMEDEKNV